MIWLMGRQKSGISVLSLQRMLEIKTYKTVWTMGHKIRQALMDWDAECGKTQESMDCQPLLFFGGKKL